MVMLHFISVCSPSLISATEDRIVVANPQSMLFYVFQKFRVLYFMNTIERTQLCI